MDAETLEAGWELLRLVAAGDAARVLSRLDAGRGGDVADFPPKIIGGEGDAASPLEASGSVACEAGTGGGVFLALVSLVA